MGDFRDDGMGRCLTAIGGPTVEDLWHGDTDMEMGGGRWWFGASLTRSLPSLKALAANV